MVGFEKINIHCRPRAGGDPLSGDQIAAEWIPAFAGMTRGLSFTQISIAFMALLLSACAGVGGITKQPPRLEVASFADMPGWQADDLSGFAASALKSCAGMMKKPLQTAVKPRGVVGDFKPFCDALTGGPLGDTAALRTLIETYLTPWRVTVSGETEGLFTGYYEPFVRASRTQHGAYQIPIRARPLDHVVVDAGAFRPDLKGVRLTGQLVGTAGEYRLVPYPDRAGIEGGKIPPAADRVIAWADDAADVFFMEIQGSGRISLEDGSEIQLSFAERNGQKYVPIGKILAERGDLPKDQVSMQTIRAWMSAHPDQARALMHENPSYIFFRDVTALGGAVGAQGVPLTPLRSLAVDPAFWSYGVPVYVDAAPVDPKANEPRIQRLVVAQDTGGAIRGALRGDLFWGAGETAARAAGPMRSRGTMWVLLPK